MKNLKMGGKMNEDEEIKWEREQEHRQEHEETSFDCWKSDNYQFLMTEFVESMYDEFAQFCLNEYKDWGND